MVKIEVAKAIDFNQLINSKEAEVVSMRILNQSNSYISLFSLSNSDNLSAIICASSATFSGSNQVWGS